jgi:uncharacterized protein (TIGR02271 family)
LVADGDERLADAVTHRCEMSTSVGSSQIGVGDDVLGSDGEKVGTVAEVQPSYLVVEKGFFFPTDYYIPLSAVASAGNGQVFLRMPKDAALQSGWDTVPDTGTLLTDVEVTATGQGPAVSQTEAGGYEVAAGDELRIPVVEEELTATVRPAETGAVRIEKRVVEEDRVLDVPVTDEQIRVERRIVDRPVGADETQAFEEIVIDVPLTREQVELHKQARVAEEIVVTKEAVKRTERVSDTVRREEVYVDEDATLIEDAEGGPADRA